MTHVTCPMHERNAHPIVNSDQLRPRGGATQGCWNKVSTDESSAPCSAFVRIMFVTTPGDDSAI